MYVYFFYSYDAIAFFGALVYGPTAFWTFIFLCYCFGIFGAPVQPLDPEEGCTLSSYKGQEEEEEEEGVKFGPKL